MKDHSLLCASLFLVSCVTDPDGARSEHLTVAGQLKQSCPLMVTCDENFEYHAYAGDIDSLNFYFSFKPGIVKDKSSEGVLAAINYLYFTLSFPSLATDSSVFYVRSPTLWGRKNDSLPFKSEITGYANGKLRGRVVFPVQQLTERIESRAPGCSAGDIAGICYKPRDLKNPINYVLDFEVELKE